MDCCCDCVSTFVYELFRSSKAMTIQLLFCIMLFRLPAVLMFIHQQCDQLNSSLKDFLYCQAEIIKIRQSKR